MLTPPFGGFFIIEKDVNFDRISFELTGMSVRALEKPMCFGANAS